MNTDISFGIDKTKTKKAETASETLAVSQTAVNKESFRSYFQWRLMHSRGFSSYVHQQDVEIFQNKINGNLNHNVI